MKLHNYLFYSILLFINFSCMECFAYRERVHKTLNNSIIDQQQLSGTLNSYVPVQLGYSSVRSIVDGKPINEWFKDAGALEDKPAWRTRHHFLDPVNNKGFSGLVDGLFQLGEPTVVWAQKGVGQQRWLDGGAHSWQDAREYFYTALISDTKAVREKKLTDSFRALGQVMHLVGDMSVPEHTRDTSHILSKTIEPWLEEVLNKDTTTHLYSKYFAKMSYALSHPIAPNASLLQQNGRYPSAPIPIANLYDSETYITGSNPDITVTGPIGLAEYTNANFFSIGTEFKNYAHPAEENTIMYEEADPVTGEIKTFAASAEVNHLVQTNVFHRYLVFFRTYGYALEDDRIRADYMDKLIPRAVGYAGALVDYFYRGTLNATAASGDISFHSAKVTVSNNTPGEAMGIGDVSLVIRYKALAETGSGPVKTLNYSTADYSYKVARLQNVDLSAPRELTFDFSNDPMPVYFEDISMQLVYRGPLGNESNAVAVSPITPLDGIYTDFTVSLPPSGVYAKTSDNTPNAIFNELRVTALTDIPGGLSGGTISMVLEYRTAIGDQFQSVLVNSEPVDAASYIIRKEEKNGVTTLAQGVPTELVFDLSSSPISVNAMEVDIIILYTDNVTLKVTSVGVRNISEPTPVDVYNNTDYTCINSTWYRYDDPEAIVMAVANEIDINPHTISNISFLTGPANAGTLNASASSTLFAAGPLPAGQMLRLGYILTDYTNRYAYSETRTGPIGDPYSHSAAPINMNFTGSGFRDDATMWNSMFAFRGVKMWSGAGPVFINTEYNGTCTWDALNQELGF